MIPQGLFSLWFAFQKPSLVDQSNCLDPSANTSSGLLVPSQEKFLQRKLQGRNREKLNIHTSMHSRMEENNLPIANNFYFKLIRKAMRATGQSILRGKTDKSRKLSQQTWVTNLWRNMGGGKNTLMKKAGLGKTRLQGKSIGLKSQLEEDDRAVLWCWVKDRQEGRSSWLQWGGQWIHVEATATDRITAWGKYKENGEIKIPKEFQKFSYMLIWKRKFWALYCHFAMKEVIS